MCIYCQFHSLVKKCNPRVQINHSLSMRIKFFEKNIPTFINYFYKYVYYVCPLSTIINKNGNKIFRKKIFQLSLIISISMFITYVH